MYRQPDPLSTGCVWEAFEEKAYAVFRSSQSPWGDRKELLREGTWGREDEGKKGGRKGTEEGRGDIKV